MKSMTTAAAAAAAWIAPFPKLLLLFFDADTASVVVDHSSLVVGTIGTTITSSLENIINNHNNNNNNINDALSLWLLRGASALLSYAGCVAYWDRPRGGERIIRPTKSYPTLLDDNNNDDDHENYNNHNHNNCFLQVAPSSVTGAGLGLFVKQQRLERGTILGTYPGVVVPLAQHVRKLQTAPQCEAYTWRFADQQQMLIDPTNSDGILDDTCHGGNPNTWGSMFLFATVFRNWQVSTTLCRINEPPLGKDVNVITVEDVQKRQVVMILERDVYPGEELFMDYGRDYDRTRYGQ